MPTQRLQLAQGSLLQSPPDSPSASGADATASAAAGFAHPAHIERSQSRPDSTPPLISSTPTSLACVREGVVLMMGDGTVVFPWEANEAIA